MSTYQIDTPDGSSYKVEADTDEQAQSAINSYLPSNSGKEDLPFLNKVAQNAIPDAKSAALGYGNAIKEGAYDMPVRALQTGLQMAGGVPYAQTPSGQKDAEIANNNPQDQLKAMADPVLHPIKFTEEHPVQQAINAFGLLSGLRGAPTEAPKVPGSPEIPALGDTVGNRIAARTTSQALDLNPMAVRKLAEKMKVSPEDVTLNLGKAAEKHLPEDFISPMASANSKFSTVLKAHEGFGDSIGKIVDATSKGTKNSFPEAQQTIDALKAKAENYFKVDGGDVALQKTAERLEKLQKAGKLDFDRLYKVKSEIGSGFGDKNVPAGTHEIYDILNDTTENVVKRISSKDPKIAPELERLKEGYTATSRLLPAMARTAAKEVSGASSGGGIMSKAIPAAVGGAIGGPIGAVGAAGLKYLQEAIAPDLGKNLAYMAMKAKPNVGVNPNVLKALIASNLANQQQPSQNSLPIESLISQLKQKYDQRRSF